MATIRVIAIAGSLRKDSHNRALLETARTLVPEGMEIEQFFLDDIPPYNMDLEEQMPAAVLKLKEAVFASDGVLLGVPEHNYSYSGVLKNAIDWGSRPYGKSCWDGKPVIMQSAAAGFMGGCRAQLHMRQVFGYLNMKQMYFPEVFVGSSHTKFDANLKVTDALSIENITKQLVAFKAFIEHERR